MHKSSHKVSVFDVSVFFFQKSWPLSRILAINKQITLMKLEDLDNAMRF